MKFPKTLEEAGLEGAPGITGVIRSVNGLKDYSKLGNTFLEKDFV